MNGDRMTTAQARKLVGQQVALAGPDGQFAAGVLTELVDQPQAVIRTATGEVMQVTISHVTSWAAPDKPTPAAGNQEASS